MDSSYRVHWRKLNIVTQPDPRERASMRFCQGDNNVYLAGGRKGGRAGSYFNDLWRFDTGSQTWTEVFAGSGYIPAAGMPFLESPETDYVTPGDDLLLFGGETGINPYTGNPTWHRIFHRLNLATMIWTQVYHYNQRQYTGWGSSIVSDWINKRWVQFGGEEGKNLTPPAYNQNPFTVIIDWGGGLYANSTWSLLETGQPPRRIDAAMVYVQSLQKVFLAHGAGVADAEAGIRLTRNDLWEFDCTSDTWTQRSADTGLYGSQYSVFLEETAFDKPLILTPNGTTYDVYELDTSTYTFSKIDDADASASKPHNEIAPSIVWDPVKEKGYVWYGNSTYWGGNDIPETWEFWFAPPELPDATPPERSISLSVNVSEVVNVTSPRPREAWNQFDEHGLLVGLTRLRGETNWHFRRRIADAMVHAANSAYQGMVHGVTRELGLALQYPVSINPKRYEDGSFMAADPYILFDGVWLYLYSDYANNLLDFQIDRYQTGGNYEHVQNLVDLINTTAFFEAEVLGVTDKYTRSMTILNQSNRLIHEEPVQVSTKFKLKYPYLVKGSVFFSDLQLFKTRKSLVSGISSSGDYHIDYQNGIVTTYTPPPVSAYVRYEHTVYPFNPIASPIILHDINQDSFRVKLFEQILQDDGSYEHGLPTELGVDIINELMSVKPMYWGI